MPFGLKNAKATYQRAMNDIFHDMIFVIRFYSHIIKQHILLESKSYIFSSCGGDLVRDLFSTIRFSLMMFCQTTNLL